MKLRDNTASIYLYEYFTRKSLSEIGFTFSGENLSPEKVEAFNLITDTITKERSRKVGGKNTFGASRR